VAQLADAKFAKVENHTVYPLADGQTTLRVEYAGHTAEVPVNVVASEVTPPVSFKQDVMPVFMRAGCNMGSCHGAARGKDGFRLSLFGFDPDSDFNSLTHEIAFRRINLALPAESLLLEKSVGAVPHTGGKRFGTDSVYYATLLKWLEAGAVNDPAPVPAVSKVEIYPPQAVIEGLDSTQQFIARATYADGTDRDVTHLAVFMSNNDNSAAMSVDGLVTAKNRGEAFVMARFNTHTVGSQVLVLPKDLQYSPPAETPVNYIDELVGVKLQQLRMLPSPLCSDEVYLRRVTIDITGLLPTAEEYREFIDDPAPDKRAKLVDRLLARKEFAEIWAMKWANLLMIRSGGPSQVKPKSVHLYFNWLTNKIANNVPIDQIARELLGAKGGTFTNPAANFFDIERNTLPLAENVAQVFMGMRIQCAQCHNHPFDRWTMDDYYGFTAFFTQVGRKEGEDYREAIIFNRGSGESKHPVGGKDVPPKFLGGDQPDVAGKDRREVLAQWLASPQNPYFATSIANRIWAHFFGIGIVEPVDDVRISNPPSNPRLYETLGQKLTEYNYDFKRMVRDICLSNAYQRSTERNASNAEDEKNFAHGTIRRIPAESVLDCISQVTQNDEKLPGLPLGARAVQIADGAANNYFLTTFGRSQRTTVCDCEATTDPTLSQALHLMNGDTLGRKIQQGKVIDALIAEGKTPSQVVDRLYLAAVGRLPTEEEWSKLSALLPAEGDPKPALQDIFWAVLNSREFLFNH
jgi:hypothetical protein